MNRYCMGDNMELMQSQNNMPITCMHQKMRYAPVIYTPIMKQTPSWWAFCKKSDGQQRHWMGTHRHTCRILLLARAPGAHLKLLTRSYTFLGIRQFFSGKSVWPSWRGICRSRPSALWVPCNGPAAASSQRGTGRASVVHRRGIWGASAGHLLGIWIPCKHVIQAIKALFRLCLMFVSTFYKPLLKPSLWPMYDH